MVTAPLEKLHLHCGARTLALMPLNCGDPEQAKNPLFGRGSSRSLLQFVQELVSEAVCQTNESAVMFSNVTPFAVTVIVLKVAIPSNAIKCWCSTFAMRV